MEFTETCQFSALTLNGLRLKVKLGCGEEERQVPQFVRFDVRLRFSSPPRGCFSDNLEETTCYAQLSDQLHQICDQGEYLLIEKLGWKAFVALKRIIAPTSQLWLRVTKEKPPIADPLQDGASFCIGDWAEF
jgi:dihydroneopterin aldolase